MDFHEFFDGELYREIPIERRDEVREIALKVWNRAIAEACEVFRIIEGADVEELEDAVLQVYEELQGMKS